MDIREWYEKVTNGDSGNQVAEKAGISQSTLSRQVNSGRFSAEVVVAVARRYGASPIRGLIILGLVTREEFEKEIRAVQLSEYTDGEIVEEVARRLVHLPESGTDYDKPIKLNPASSIPFPTHPERTVDLNSVAAKHSRSRFHEGLDEDEMSQLDP